MKKRFLLVALLLLFPGCASQTLKPGMILTYTPPVIDFAKDPEVNFDKYRNFALCPAAELISDSDMNPIVEKQLLFIVRNQLELLGYNYVDEVSEADFVVRIYYSNEYKSQYIPPSSATIPWYVPGQTYTSNINLYGSSGYTWGTATTTTPGYYVPMTITRPGYYTGSYYPCVCVVIINPISQKIEWSGTAIVATPQSDIRLSSHVLLPRLLLGEEGNNFPSRSGLDKRDDSKNGAFGIIPSIITLDGNSFYPIIFWLACDSPAHKQGVKVYDIITRMDGKSTLNWSFCRAMEAFNKSKGEELILTIKRGEKVFERSLVAEDETVAKETWRKIQYPNEKGSVITTKIPFEP